MIFYHLVCEQQDGFKFVSSSSLSSSRQEIETYLTKFCKDLYRTVEIKSVEISVEEIVIALVKGKSLDKLLFPDPNKE